MLNTAISHTGAGLNLGRNEARDALDEILCGDATDAQIVRFLASLASKGETDEELCGMLDCMEKHMVKVTPKCFPLTDVCGTGGDGRSTMNVSTAAAFIAASAGISVAKHGNRGSSGGLGSAGVFERLGCDLEQDAISAARTLDKFGICFMFARHHHPAMKYVAEARKSLGRTAFNLLGPLCNPAGVRRQLVGVYDDMLLERIPRLLMGRGAHTVMAVRSADGLDELSTSSKNKACMASKDNMNTFTIDPESFGLHRSSVSDICAKSTEEAMSMLVSAIEGRASRAVQETVTLNAAAALWVGGAASDMQEGLEMAVKSVQSGAASKLLEDFVRSTGKMEALEEARRI